MAGLTRDEVLRAAVARRRPAHPVPPCAAAYAARVAALQVLLPELPGDACVTPVIHGWVPYQVVGHLMASDRLLAAALGAPLSGSRPSSDDPEAYTDAVLAAARGPEEVLAGWRAQAAMLCAFVAAADPGLEETKVTASGMRLRVRDHLTNRAFETWVHTTDIAEAAGISMPHPVASHVHAMTDMGCRSLPFAHQVGGGTRSGTVEMRLGGPGGGTWVVRLGEDPESQRSTIVMDAVEFCFLFADRRDPRTVEAEADGPLARELLDTAPRLVRLGR
ncbi:MAG TPA: maleylpyruvate isomerase family mycothiol-dependent enzyme [Nonomuraea sp.]|nr:maleylpyruvate isomerase family mycothiol-dependent enzyme [Nonomuraea sp.]